MYGTETAINLQGPPEGNDVYARLNWLVAANGYEERRRQLYRSALEEEEMLLMRRPLTARRTYALFGLMLGVFPPAAIFTELFGYGFSGGSGILFLIFLFMNLICAVVGYWMGVVLSGSIADWERRSWSAMLLLVMVLGMGWGAATGAAGGFIFFGIGAIVGAYFAILVGAVAFPLFAVLHRLVWRGGMIDARHFWPLAAGVTMTITALILGL